MYYNNNWEVLCDYNEAGVLQLWYAYGNYMDEALLMGTSPGPPLAKFYGHDHLYRPVALVEMSGNVNEGYEYDAHGNFYILEGNFESLF